MPDIITNSLPRPAGLIFDLDGTMIDTADDLAAAMNHALSLHDIAPLPTDTVRHLVGHGAKAMIRAGYNAAMGHAPDEKIVDALIVDFIEFYTANIAVHSRPFPGLVAMLDAMAELGIRLTVCTNKREDLARPLLAALDLTDYFDAIIGGDTAGIAKPDPKPVQLCLDAMGLDAMGPDAMGPDAMGLDAMGLARAEAGRRVLFIGDSDTDIRAAKATGLRVVICDFGYGPLNLLGQADAILDNYFDAPALFLSMLEGSR